MRLLIALVHESFTTSILAGLLTYSIFEHPSHSLRNSGIEYRSKILEELTAAGLFRICT